jgi:hypothetical protein
MPDNTMNDLDQILANATRSIEAGYFYLRIAGGGHVYRERVYCYELYHQLRVHWPTDSQFYLNGEVDKSAHPLFGNLRTKPDLLVHQPGSMDGNFAIIEVKSPSASSAGISKDLTTLCRFIRDLNYKRAIYLIYGADVDDRLFKRILRRAENIKISALIELWVHREAGAPAEFFATLQTT